MTPAESTEGAHPRGRIMPAPHGQAVREWWREGLAVDQSNSERLGVSNDR